LADRL